MLLDSAQTLQALFYIAMLVFRMTLILIWNKLLPKLLLTEWVVENMASCT